MIHKCTSVALFMSLRATQLIPYWPLFTFYILSVISMIYVHFPRTPTMNWILIINMHVQQMMRNLCVDEGDFIQIDNVSLPVATYAKFQPQSVDFLDITNPKAVYPFRQFKFRMLSLILDNLHSWFFPFNLWHFIYRILSLILYIYLQDIGFNFRYLCSYLL